MLPRPVKKSISLEVETCFPNDVLKDKNWWNDLVARREADDDLRVVQVTVMKIQRKGKKK